MDFIMIDPKIDRHPKTLKLSRTLGIDVRETVRRLLWVWKWAFEFAPSGDVAELLDDDNLADCVVEVDDHGAGASFIKAMRDAGFIEGTALRNWRTNGSGKLFEKRAKHAEYMRNQRRETHVNSTCAAVKPKRRREKRREESPQTPQGAGGSIYFSIWKQHRDAFYMMQPPRSTKLAEVAKLVGEDMAPLVCEFFRHAKLSDWRISDATPQEIDRAFAAAKKAMEKNE